MKKQSSEFLKLYYERDALLRERDELALKNQDLALTIRDLNKCNDDLKTLLNSKRYSMTDLLVDSLCKAVRRKNKKQLLLEENEHVVSESSAKVDKLVKPDRSTTPHGSDCMEEVATKTRIVKRGKVDIINYSFFDWDGNVVNKGGAERYVYDVSCLLKQLGYRPRIIQCSNTPFKKKYNGVEVIGVGQGDRYSARYNSKLFGYYCSDCEFVIASPFKLACEITDIPIIGINHGIDFDPDWNRYYNDYEERDKELIDALKNVSKCVCVDTNFINWTRTIDYALAMKEEYIPNYYDEVNFGVTLQNKPKRKDGKLVFVYPRRIYEARGSDITIRAFKRLLQTYSDRIIINFVGQIENDKSKKSLKGLMDAFPKNVFRMEYHMDDMAKAYEGADVALIPTRYCEGTSLSCIEGMAMGCAIIATTVGGLTNLVVDGYNGKLISPTTDALISAVTELIENPSMIKRMARNGNDIVKTSFTKAVWDEKWKRIIVGFADKRS